jgi:hypothetical protein
MCHAEEELLELKILLFVTVAQRKLSAVFYSKYADIFCYSFLNFNPRKSKQKLVIDFICFLTNEATR